MLSNGKVASVIAHQFHRLIEMSNAHLSEYCFFAFFLFPLWVENVYVAEGGFDPPTSGLWAQHASSAPLC